MGFQDTVVKYKIDTVMDIVKSNAFLSGLKAKKLPISVKKC